MGQTGVCCLFSVSRCSAALGLPRSCAPFALHRAAPRLPVWPQGHKVADFYINHGSFWMDVLASE